jgi:hypothetical protein
MSKQQLIGRARERRARRIRFDTAGPRVLAYICTRGHRHATFMHALACEGRRSK